MEFDPSSMTDDCYHLLVMSLCYRDREATRRSLESKLEAIDIERANVLMQSMLWNRRFPSEKRTFKPCYFLSPRRIHSPQPLTANLVLCSRFHHRGKLTQVVANICSSRCMLDAPPVKHIEIFLIFFTTPSAQCSALMEILHGL